MRFMTGLVLVALAPGCGSDGLSPRPSTSAPRGDLTPDAGPDAGPPVVTRCCELDSARGERLDYKCGVAIDTGWLEERGYRCWLVTSPR